MHDWWLVLFERFSHASAKQKQSSQLILLVIHSRSSFNFIPFYCCCRCYSSVSLISWIALSALSYAYALAFPLNTYGKYVKVPRTEKKNEQWWWWWRGSSSSSNSQALRKSDALPSHRHCCTFYLEFRCCLLGELQLKS